MVSKTSRGLQIIFENHWCQVLLESNVEMASLINVKALSYRVVMEYQNKYIVLAKVGLK